MKTPVLVILLLCSVALTAQSADNYAKLGTNVFFLSNGRAFNHTFVNLGGGWEHQFNKQVAGALQVNAARLVGDAKPDVIDGYIRNINSLEAEIRFYPNKKGRGFYAGASLLLYRDTRIIGAATKHANHLGSHINTGVQFPMRNDFYLQLNGQLGIYGKGYLTIARYGLQLMAAKRF
jgi:hypothetical protein